MSWNKVKQVLLTWMAAGVVAGTALTAQAAGVEVAGVKLDDTAHVANP